MAKILINDFGIDIPEQSPIKETCEEIGVPFGCRSGLCGTCKIKVLEGMENLMDLTERELEMGLEPNERLACQCSIRTGIVKITVG